MPKASYETFLTTLGCKGRDGRRKRGRKGEREGEREGGREEGRKRDTLTKVVAFVLHKSETTEK